MNSDCWNFVTETNKDDTEMKLSFTYICMYNVKEIKKRSKLEILRYHPKRTAYKCPPWELPLGRLFELSYFLDSSSRKHFSFDDSKHSITDLNMVCWCLLICYLKILSSFLTEKRKQPELNFN